MIIIFTMESQTNLIIFNMYLVGSFIADDIYSKGSLLFLGILWFLVFIISKIGIHKNTTRR